LSKNVYTTYFEKGGGGGGGIMQESFYPPLQRQVLELVIENIQSIRAVLLVAIIT
jgi:hypothetical protein